MYSLLHFSGGKWVVCNSGHKTMIEAMNNLNTQSGCVKWTTKVLNIYTVRFTGVVNHMEEVYDITWTDESLTFKPVSTGKSVVEVFHDGIQVGNIIQGKFFGYSDTSFTTQELIQIAVECGKMK